MCKNYDFQCLTMKIKQLNISTVKNLKKLLLQFTPILNVYLKNANTNLNNNQNKSTIKINNHVPCGYSMFTHCSFDNTKNKLNHCRGEDCMKKFTNNLKDHVSIIITYEQK